MRERVRESGAERVGRNAELRAQSTELSSSQRWAASWKPTLAKHTNTNIELNTKEQQTTNKPKSDQITKRLTPQQQQQQQQQKKQKKNIRKQIKQKIIKNNKNWVLAIFYLVPGAGLEPATFGCLRHTQGLYYAHHQFRKRRISSKKYPMSPTRYQLRHPGDVWANQKHHLSIRPK